MDKLLLLFRAFNINDITYGITWYTDIYHGGKGYKSACIRSWRFVLYRPFRRREKKRRMLKNSWYDRRESFPSRSSNRGHEEMEVVHPYSRFAKEHRILFLSCSLPSPCPYRSILSIDSTIPDCIDKRLQHPPGYKENESHLLSLSPTIHFPDIILLYVCYV